MRSKEEVSRKLEESLRAEQIRFNLFQNNYISLSNSFPGEWVAMPGNGEVAHDTDYRTLVRSLEARGMNIRDFYFRQLRAAS